MMMMMMMTMVCNTFVQRPELDNTTFRKLELFPSSGEEMESPIPLGPLERTNINHCSGSGLLNKIFKTVLR
jgi:hypothetical protein